MSCQLVDVDGAFRLILEASGVNTHTLPGAFDSTYVCDMSAATRIVNGDGVIVM